jgi:hypothetical protein
VTVLDELGHVFEHAIVLDDVDTIRYELHSTNTAGLDTGDRSYGGVQAGDGSCIGRDGVVREHSIGAD